MAKAKNKAVTVTQAKIATLNKVAELVTGLTVVMASFACIMALGMVILEAFNDLF